MPDRWLWFILLEQFAIQSASMSHIQNLQRLRSNSNSNNSKQLSSSPYEKAVNKFKLNNLNNLATLRLNIQPTSEIYKKFLDSKPIIIKKQSPRKLSGISSAHSSVNERKEESKTTSISIRNLSVKLPRKDSISNPLTERRDHVPDLIEDSYELKPNQEVINKSSFKPYYVIGKGGFGKVWKVQMKKSGKIYAMKEMYKTKIINKKSINSVMNEKELLSKLNHPLLVNMSYAFQDKQNLYLIMDYLNGGDLRYHIVVRRRFSQNEAKFFIACLLMCVQYLHSHHIIHRDIKPENLVLDSDGYLRLTDLGISRKWREQNASDTSGTPGYMAPEVMCHKNHSFAADYFAIGVLGYELMMGKRPYLGRDRRQIRDQILAKQAMINLDNVPTGWSKQAADFINKLLTRNPVNRLGYSNGEEVKKHPWLKPVDWVKLLRREIKAPYVPMKIEDNYDDYKQQISEDTLVEDPEGNAMLLRDTNVQELFKGYEFSISSKVTGSTRSSQHTTNLNETDELFTRIFKEGSRK